MNNTQICAMGYGSAITAPAMFHAGDNLGIAQYITKIGLLLGDNETSVLDNAKQAWLDDLLWQGLRKAVEDSLVLDDWFELFIAQNFVMDGLIHPFFFDRFEQSINEQGGTAQGMLTEFMSSWYAESTRWVDAQLKVAAAESAENAVLVSRWINKWLDELIPALTPLAEAALEDGASQLQDVIDTLRQRAAKIKIEL
jgi:phenol hydroxylase P1 protein